MSAIAFDACHASPEACSGSSRLRCPLCGQCQRLTQDLEYVPSDPDQLASGYSWPRALSSFRPVLANAQHSWSCFVTTRRLGTTAEF